MAPFCLEQGQQGQRVIHPKERFPLYRFSWATCMSIVVAVVLRSSSVYRKRKAWTASERPQMLNVFKKGIAHPQFRRCSMPLTKHSTCGTNEGIPATALQSVWAHKPKLHLKSSHRQCDQHSAGIGIDRNLAKALDNYLAKEGSLEDPFSKQILRNYQPCVSTPNNKESVNQWNTVSHNSCPILYPTASEEHPINNNDLHRVALAQHLLYHSKGEMLRREQQASVAAVSWTFSTTHSLAPLLGLQQSHWSKPFGRLCQSQSSALSCRCSWKASFNALLHKWAQLQSFRTATGPGSLSWNACIPSTVDHCSVWIPSTCKARHKTCAGLGFAGYGSAAPNRLLQYLEVKASPKPSTAARRSRSTDHSSGTHQVALAKKLQVHEQHPLRGSLYTWASLHYYSSEVARRYLAHRSIVAFLLLFHIARKVQSNIGFKPPHQRQLLGSSRAVAAS